MVFLRQLENLKDKQYWQKFASDFHIENHELMTKIKELDIEESILKQAEEEMKTEGYFHLKQALDTKALADLIEKLVSANLLPIFALVYDEFWLIQAKAKKLYERILGQSYYLRPCIWAWHLDPKQEEAGWKPHRDGDANCINSDLSPKVVSSWIPLTDTDPLNGCMYIVPMNRELNKPHEATGQLDFNLPDIRALPAKAGDIFVWNHWVIHWGSRSSKKAKNTRMSIGFEMEVCDSNITDAPQLDPFTLPSFEDRLKIIAYQIHQYTHMYKFTDEMRNFAINILENKCLSLHIKQS